MREMNVERIFEEYNRNSDELALKSRSFLPACLCRESERHLRMTNKCGIRRKLIAMKYGFLRTAHNCKQQFKETSLLSNLGSAHTHTHTHIAPYPHIYFFYLQYWNHSSSTKSQLFSTSTAIFFSFLCVLLHTKIKTLTSDILKCQRQEIQ